jgi:hypothetical protein
MVLVIAKNHIPLTISDDLKHYNAHVEFQSKCN